MKAMNFLTRFVNYAFYTSAPLEESDVTKDNPIIVAEEGNIGEKRKSGQNRPQLKEDLKLSRSILKIASLIVGVICLVSFFSLIILSFLDKPTPELLKDSFMLTLGYFLSSLTAFIEKTVSKP